MLESLEARQLLASDVQLLGNLNPKPFESNPSQLVSVGDTAFFTATTAGGTAALWKTDGTAAGTTLVQDFGDTVRQPRSLTNVNGTLFFSNYDEFGYELWKSDGTAAGTTRVADIFEGQAGSYPQELTAVGSTLFFRAFSIGGTELWKSDGTEAGTVQVKDIVPGGGGSDPQQLINVGGTLFFSAQNAAWGRELWKSDGTAATTTLVKNIFSGSGDSNPSDFAEVNGVLFFAATDAAGGRELWRSEGTSATTWRFKDIQPGSDSSSPAEITPVSESDFYFTATDSTGGRELWRSNGTWAGTQRLADIAPGSDSSNPSELTNVGGTLFFAAAAQPWVGKLWTATGGSASEIGEFFVNPTNLTNVGGNLMFTAVDATGGRELWKAAIDENQGLGTSFVKDIYQDSTGSYPDSLIDFNGTLLFAAADSDNGRELWRSDGTSAGTQLVKDLVPGNESSHPHGFTNVNGTVYFTAYEPDTGYELWKTDGTTAGTMLVADIFPGGTGSAPSNLVNVNGKLFFAATDPEEGRELWTSDGTWAGTRRVKDLRTGVSASGVPNSSSPSELTNLNGLLMFTAETSQGVELWRSDGTPSGTFLVKDIFDGSASSNPAELINVKGTLFFRATDAAGQELWKSNGTAAGTVMLRDMYAGSASSFPKGLTNLNGTLLFAATTAFGVELWKSNGTTAGTVLVKDIVSGGGSSFPQELTNVAGTLFFTANAGAAGREVWKTDGTSGGTVLVRDIIAGLTGSYPTDLVNVGGTLFFGAKNATSGRELWKSDGTSSGTWQVKDIFPGSSGSNPTDLFNVNGLLYFSAKDPTAGYELWRSDGTGGGTVRLTDIANGAASSRPTNLSEANGTLLMAATNFQGEELYGLAAEPNIAPVLAAKPVPTFGPINEDTLSYGGTLVKYLVNTTQSDVDAGALKGVAIVWANTPNGTWQYSLDNGKTWRDMGKCSATDARLLPANDNVTRVRFIPTANFNGPVWLGYRAWDQTQGTRGSLFDVTDHLGGSNAFSTLQKSVKLVVNPVNDAPVVDTTVDLRLSDLVEDEPATSNDGMLVADLVFGAISDVDDGAEQGIAVINDGNDSLGKWQYSLNNGTAWLDFNDVDSSTARLLPADAQTRVRFLPAVNASGNVELRFRAWDQTQGQPGGVYNILKVGSTTAFSSSTDVATQFIQPVNDAPVINLGGQPVLTPLSKSGSNPGTLVKDLIAGKITDPDPDALSGIAVVKAGDMFTQTYFGHWEFTINNGITWNELHVDGDTDAVLLAADNLTRLRFVPLANSSSQFSVTLDFRAWDQTEGLNQVGIAEPGFDCSDKLGGTHAFSTQKATARQDVQP